MAIRVVAEAPGAYAAWRQNQTRPAEPAAPDRARGQALFVAHCGACHAVRGAEAGGLLGPDLTHLMTRQTLAAGAAANDTGGLSGWIANPQALKPGAQMPAALLSGPQLAATVAYLETLK
jgi:cytochrome c oxidase subunit 2